MAVCVAVVGKDDNCPLYLKCRSSSSKDSSDLQYHYIVSSALDIVEERVHSSTKALTPASGTSEATRELYLGALTAQEDYKVYGYMTNTRIKLIIVIEEHSISVPIRENDIRMMFRRLHGGFCDLMSNPFYAPGSKIVSDRFSSVVDSILQKA